MAYPFQCNLTSPMLTDFPRQTHLLYKHLVTLLTMYPINVLVISSENMFVVHKKETFYSFYYGLPYCRSVVKNAKELERVSLSSLEQEKVGQIEN